MKLIRVIFLWVLLTYLMILLTANGASFYADKNLAYWDPSLSDVASTLNAAKVDGATNWYCQMITMNSRTQAMFNNKTKYPKLTKWYMVSK